MKYYYWIVFICRLYTGGEDSIDADHVVLPYLIDTKEKIKAVSKRLENKHGCEVLITNIILLRATKTK